LVRLKANPGKREHNILLTGMIFVGRDALGAPGRRALHTAEIYDRFKYNKNGSRMGIRIGGVMCFKKDY